MGYNNGNTGITVNRPLGLPDEPCASFVFYVVGPQKASTNFGIAQVSNTRTVSSILLLRRSISKMGKRNRPIQFTRFIADAARMTLALSP